MNYAKTLFTGLLIIFLSAASFSYASDRDQFRHWSDLDANGRDSRQDTLIKSMVGGILCPYTGQIIGDMSSVDIDHIVPLQYAWDHGASSWTATRREHFANDPHNLIAVDASTNRAKGAKPPSEWIPPNLRYASQYIQAFADVCIKYSLSCDFIAMSEQMIKLSSYRNGMPPGRLL